MMALAYNLGLQNTVGPIPTVFYPKYWKKPEGQILQFERIYELLKTVKILNIVMM